MVMTGANYIFHGVGVFNLAAGGVLVTIILALTGVSWQRSNITKWIQMELTRRLSCLGQTNIIRVDRVAIPVATPRIRLLTTGVDSNEARQLIGAMANVVVRCWFGDFFILVDDHNRFCPNISELSCLR